MGELGNQVGVEKSAPFFILTIKQNKTKQYEKSEKTDVIDGDVRILIRSKSTRDYI